MGGRLQPALLGGLFIGVLSTLPIVSFGNACCCLWVISGGALSAWLLQKNQAEPITAADGALIGLMAGIVAGFVSAFLSIPVQIYFGPVMKEWADRIIAGGNVPPALIDAVGELDAPVTPAFVLVRLISGLVIYVIFGMLGGVLGVAIFRRKEIKTQD
jgi:hypothetical protein